MSTEYKFRLTVIAPETLRRSANHLVACRGIGESGSGDLHSFLPSSWTLGDIALSVICPAVTNAVIDNLSLALHREFVCAAPDWDSLGEVNVTEAQDVLDNAYIVAEFNPDSSCEWDGSQLLVVANTGWKEVLAWAGVVSSHYPE